MAELPETIGAWLTKRDEEDKGFPVPSMDDMSEESAQDNIAVEAMLEQRSCFLPGTNIQFAWDSTSLGYLKQCPRLYYYQMIEGWQARGENEHLRFGIEYHQALYDYDTERAADIDHDEAVHDVIRELLIRTYDWKSEHKTKNRPALVRAVVWYLEHFKNDTAKTVLLEEGKPACEHSFKFELDWGPQGTKDAMIEGEEVAVQPYLLCGHFDKVVNFNDDLFIMDRKTTSFQPGPYYFDKFDPDNQMTLYAFAAQVVFDSPIRGVIIDAVQIKASVDYDYICEFGRGFTYRTKDTIDEWVNDLQDWLEKAEGYATKGHWPKNDTACDRFGGCKFRDICTKSPSVREQFLKSNFVQLPEEERWNPLKAR